MTQRRAAEILGVTEATVSRYLSGKRAELELSNENIQNEIDKSIAQILDNGNSTIAIETCRICKILRSENILDDLKNYQSC